HLGWNPSGDRRGALLGLAGAVAGTAERWPASSLRRSQHAGAAARSGAFAGIGPGMAGACSDRARGDSAAGQGGRDVHQRVTIDRYRLGSMIKFTHLRAAIFDWAGTVVDHGSLAPMGAFVNAFAEFDVDISIDEARGPMGMAKRPHIATLMALPRIAEAWK